MIVNEDMEEDHMTVANKDFSCMKGGMTIRGKEYADSEAKGKLIPVVIAHGFTADMRRSQPYAEYMAEKGYRAFIFDFCGGGFETISDGSFHDYMTPLSEVDDLKAVVSYLKTRDDIDFSKLILAGCSQGGFVAALTAAQLKDEVHGLALFYPALCIPDDARAGSMQVIRFDPDNIPECIGEGRMRLSGNYARSVIRLNVFEEIDDYTGNVFIIHGTADNIVNYGYSLVADEVYRKHGADTQLHLLPDAGHGFSGDDLEESCILFGKWADSLK